MVYKDGVLQDTGEGLAKGTFIEGKNITERVLSIKNKNDKN